MREKPFLFLNFFAPVVDFIYYSFDLTYRPIKNSHIDGINLTFKYNDAQKGYYTLRYSSYGYIYKQLTD